MVLYIYLQEKGKTEDLDTYILYPASPNDTFLDIPASPGQVDHDEPECDSRGDLLTPSPDSLHFHLPASNLDKASACIKEGILSREIPKPREGGSACPVRRRRRKTSHKRHDEVDIDIVWKSKSTQLDHSMGSKQGDGMKLVDDDAGKY